MDSPFDFINARKPEIQAVKDSTIERQVVGSIPEKDKIPLEGPKWLQSTGLACAYFEAEFIDVRGDGGFGIFVGDKACVPALCAAVTFKTLCRDLLQNAIEGFKISPHIGIDQKAVLFKRIGLRGDWQNVVWAGKPVSMSAKLSSLSVEQEITVSDRVYEIFSEPKFYKYAIMSCGCEGGAYTRNTTNLWRERDVSDKTYLDFEKAYSLSSDWCTVTTTVKLY